MQIGNPAALWLLLVIAAWLLLGRNQTARPRRPVGNLYLWSQPASSAPVDVALRRVRRHWLILLQAALLTLLVLALARPSFSWQGPRVALVIDVSASMAARESGGTRMDLAKQAARAVIQSLPSRAHVMVVTAGPVATTVGEFAAGDGGLERAVQDIVPIPASADITSAIRSARMAAIDADAIHVISDSPSAPAGSDGVRWVHIGNTLPNRAITRLATRGVPGSPRAREMIATVWNYSTDEHDAVLEVLHGQRVLARRAVHLQPRQGETAVITVDGVDGAIEARLSGDDALAADDQRFAVLAARRVARVLLLGRGSFFLESALAANPAVVVDRATGAGTGIHPDVDVVVCDRCATLPPRGRGVLMIPPVQPADPAPLIVSLPEHPIAEAVAPVGPLVPGSAGADVPQDALTILRVGGRPAIIAYERDGRRVVEWRLDLSESRFTTSTTFPILLDNVLAWLDGRTEDVTAIRAGEPLHWILRNPASSSRPEIVGPDGGAIRARVSGQRLTTTDTTAVGIYEVRGDGTPRTFVVNPVTDGESDLSRGAATPPSAPVSHRPVTSPGAADHTALLLLVALALLSLEWRARSGGRRPA